MAEADADPIQDILDENPDMAEFLEIESQVNDPALARVKFDANVMVRMAVLTTHCTSRVRAHCLIICCTWNLIILINKSTDFIEFLNILILKVLVSFMTHTC
jgi:hypothetical protein